MKATTKNPKSQAFFVIIIKKLLFNEDFKKLGNPEFRVYIYLKTFENNKSGACFPSIDTLAKTIGMKRRSVIYAIQKLEKSGFIQITKELGKSNIYKFPRENENALVQKIAPVQKTTPNQCKKLHPTSARNCTLTRCINNIKEIDKGNIPTPTSQIAAFSVPKEQAFKNPTKPIKKEEKKKKEITLEAEIIQKPPKRELPKSGLNKDMRGFIKWLEKMDVRLDERHYTNIQQMERRQMDAIYYQFKREDSLGKITIEHNRWLSYVVLNIKDYNLDVGYDVIKYKERDRQSTQESHDKLNKLREESNEAAGKPHRNLMKAYCEKLGKSYPLQSKIYEERFGEAPKGV